MKANETPEKIYLLPRQGGDYSPYWRTDSQDGFGIEYVRTDAFIEKACDAYCKVCRQFDHSESTPSCRHDCRYFSDFINYMKGE